MEDLIKEFFDQNIEIYNEFSLQHELGSFLRSKLVGGHKIQFERNVLSSVFDFDKNKLDLIKPKLYKKEIDLSVYSEGDFSCVLELKYPRNGQVPESMFSFCKDIAFLEQLLFLGFKSAYFIVVAEHAHFYSGNTSGIYGFFRDGNLITGKITKPTGTKGESVEITGTYKAEWLPIAGNTKYCLIKVNTASAM